jgi:hypothetical protein
VTAYSGVLLNATRVQINQITNGIILLILNPMKLYSISDQEYRNTYILAEDVYDALAKFFNERNQGAAISESGQVSQDTSSVRTITLMTDNVIM